MEIIAEAGINLASSAGFHSMSSSLQRVINQAGRVILGKERQIRMALACLLARGHLLIEDLPGVGKTTLAHVLARSLGLGFHRIPAIGDTLTTVTRVVGLRENQRKEGRAPTGHVRPAVVVEVVLTMQQQPRHQPVGAEVPGAIDHVPAGECVPDVLSGGPVQ